MTEDCRIEDIDAFIIKTFHDSTSEVQVWIDELSDCASCWITSYQPGKAVLEINDELLVNERSNRTQVDMPVVSTQSKTLDPFRTVDRSVSPFVSDLRLQVGVPTYEDRNLGSSRSQSTWVVKESANELAKRADAF